MVLKEISKLTIEDMKPIAISFKKTEDDLIIYKWILSHSGYSNFIKDILKSAKGNDSCKEEIKSSKDIKTELLDISDF